MEVNPLKDLNIADIPEAMPNFGMSRVIVYVEYENAIAHAIDFSILHGKKILDHGKLSKQNMANMLHFYNGIFLFLIMANFLVLFHDKNHVFSCHGYML